MQQSLTALSGFIRASVCPCPSPKITTLFLFVIAGICHVWAQENGYFPPTEPSPFLPDDARWIGQPYSPGQPWAKGIHLRTTWLIQRDLRSAVLMAAPSQSVRIFLNGRLVLTGYDRLEALPVWADVTQVLRPGDNSISAVVRSEWRPLLYVQMRVEYADGQFEDFITSPDWQCRTEIGEAWSPAVDAGGYYRQGDNNVWGHEFALLPRDMLRKQFAEHNRAMEARFRGGNNLPLILNEALEQPAWARQFAGFCRLDERTGQLIDGAGQVRHLFFTVYDQLSSEGTILHLPDYDFDQYERDLDLMTGAGVHIYLRFTGWDWLLTKDGAWAPLKKQPQGTKLPRLARAVDLLDHFVRRAYVHGRYIIFEGDFYWAAHRDVVPPPYRSRYHLYPEVLEAEALAMRAIMQRYSMCPNVVGMIIGEEDIILAHDLNNPHQHALFAQFLRRKYRSLEEFRRQTSYGYDYTDHSGYRLAERKREYFPDTPAEPVLVPTYQPVAGPFDSIERWLDIPLPLWPQYRSPDQPDVVLADQKSYNEFTPFDPLWIDFYEMREDELLFEMLARWARIVRRGMPNQLLFYSNAQDFTNSWHFLHLYRRTDLPFDAIGVGCHDSGQNLSEIAPQYTVRKAIKVVSSYRPYALAAGSPSRGIASGEGEGGRPDQPEEVLNYYAGTLFDEIGGGVAWTQTYKWTHISGASEAGGPHQTPLLKWLGEFIPAVQGVVFPLRRPVHVLIVRNANLQHSNMSGLDYGNTIRVAEALSQLNLEFDIVMDRDLRYRPGPDSLEATTAAPGKNLVAPTIDLNQYRLVIIPSVAIDLCASGWRALDAWLTDPDHSGKRALAFGWIGKRGRRLEPLRTFPEMVQRWTGARDYSAATKLEGKQEVRLVTEIRETQMIINFGRSLPVGLLGEGRPLLTLDHGTVIAQQFSYGGNRVFAFGFPLGLNANELWDLAPVQEPRDAMAPIYEALVAAADVDRPVIAPHNLRVYVSGDGKMMLVRERAGLATDGEIGIRIPNGVTYRQLGQRRDNNGYAWLRVRLAPWESRWWKAG